MSSEVVYSPMAQADLDHIWSYLAVDCGNPRAASNAVNGIFDRVDLLKTFPESGTPLSSIYPIATSYRFVISGRYLAFYRYEGIVYVDRVLSAKSDYLKVLLK